MMQDKPARQSKADRADEIARELDRRLTKDCRGIFTSSDWKMRSGWIAAALRSYRNGGLDELLTVFACRTIVAGSEIQKAVSSLKSKEPQG